MVGAGHVAVLGIQDQLRATEDVLLLHVAHLVASLRQTSGDRFRKTWLQANREVREDVPAWRVTRRLGILSVIEDPLHHLEMTLVLHVPTHHPEGQARRTRFGDEAGNDGVERAFSSAELVRMTFFERKAASAILQVDTRSRHDHARAETCIIRLNEGDHHATGICRREADSATLSR